MGRLFDCGYAWEGENILGIRKAPSSRTHLGTALHASTAIMDEGQMNGEPLELDEATEVFHHHFTNPEYEIDTHYDDVPAPQLEHIGIKLNKLYYEEISPRYVWDSIEKQINGVEIDVPTQGVTIELTGKRDRSRTVNLRRKKDTADSNVNVLGPARQIWDIKSGKQAVQHGAAKTKGHRPQLGIYQLIEELQSGEAVDDDAVIVGMQTSKQPKVATGVCEKPKQLLIGTKDSPGLIELAATMLKTGIFYPNPDSWLCDERYCARWQMCPYHD